jgi:cardiolipin synthase A/B
MLRAMPVVRRASLLFVLALLLAAPALADSPVRISGVLFDGVLKGNPEPDSAIRLTNTDPKRLADIGGFSLTDGVTPGGEPDLATAAAGERQAEVRGGTARLGKKAKMVRLPPTARIAPLADVWVAHRGDAFKEVFGFAPDFETVDTLPDVPDLEHDAGWINMPAKHGTVALLDAFGNVVDFVAYDRNKEPKWRPEELPDRYWKGQAVRLHNSTAYGWTGQILARDRDEQGRLLKDTDTAKDWDSGFSHKQLGMEPAHRVELPGQSHFRSRPLKNVRAKVFATSAPDNNYQTLIDAFNDAKKEIRISVYQLTSPQITDALIKRVQQGVQVTLWLEGSPVAGIPDQERYLVDRLAKAGAQVYFLVSDSKRKVKPRYRFDHSKYVLIDDDKVIIGTENYGRTGVPVHPSHGNRGWMVHVQSKALYDQLDAVWRHDFRPGYRDVVHIDDDPNDKYGLPYRDAAFTPDTGTIQRGSYGPPVEPRLVDEPMDLELVLSPDTSLNENSAIIGMINRAKHTLYVQQNSVRRRWGNKGDSVETTPTLPLQAVVAAARRGVKVRVLLDGTWYNITDDDRDNDDTARYLNELARAEGLDVSAKVINLKSTNLEKIHAKGVIVDDREVFVGSINWSENSFKGNREVGVVISNKKVTGYYADLFRRDWSESRLYEVPAKKRTSLHVAPGGKATAAGQVQPGQRLTVVGEHGGTKAKGPAWLEVRLDRSHTAFVAASAVGEPTASAQEAIHLIGREASIEGKVVVTRVSDKVIHLRFEDEQRAPFVAVIFRKSEPRFTDKGLNPANAFQARQVRVRGMVQAYKVPEIILSSPDQIEILR